MIRKSALVFLAAAAFAAGLSNCDAASVHAPRGHSTAAVKPTGTNCAPGANRNGTSSATSGIVGQDVTPAHPLDPALCAPASDAATNIARGDTSLARPEPLNAPDLIAPRRQMHP